MAVKLTRAPCTNRVHLANLFAGIHMLSNRLGWHKFPIVDDRARHAPPPLGKISRTIPRSKYYWRSFKNPDTSPRCDPLCRFLVNRPVLLGLQAPCAQNSGCQIEIQELGSSPAWGEALCILMGKHLKLWRQAPVCRWLLQRTLATATW